MWNSVEKIPNIGQLSALKILRGGVSRGVASGISGIHALPKSG